MFWFHYRLLNFIVRNNLKFLFDTFIMALSTVTYGFSSFKIWWIYLPELIFVRFRVVIETFHVVWFNLPKCRICALWASRLTISKLGFFSWNQAEQFGFQVQVWISHDRNISFPKLLIRKLIVLFENSFYFSLFGWNLLFLV